MRDETAMLRTKPSEHQPRCCSRRTCRSGDAAGERTARHTGPGEERSASTSPFPATSAGISGTARAARLTDAKRGARSGFRGGLRDACDTSHPETHVAAHARHAMVSLIVPRQWGNVSLLKQHYFSDRTHFSLNLIFKYPPQCCSGLNGTMSCQPKIRQMSAGEAAPTPSCWDGPALPLRASGWGCTPGRGCEAGGTASPPQNPRPSGTGTRLSDTLVPRRHAYTPHGHPHSDELGPHTHTPYRKHKHSRARSQALAHPLPLLPHTHIRLCSNTVAA